MRHLGHSHTPEYPCPQQVFEDVDLLLFLDQERKLTQNRYLQGSGLLDCFLRHYYSVVQLPPLVASCSLHVLPRQSVVPVRFERQLARPAISVASCRSNLGATFGRVEKCKSTRGVCISSRKVVGHQEHSIEQQSSSNVEERRSRSPPASPQTRDGFELGLSDADEGTAMTEAKLSGSPAGRTLALRG